ncbi:hypothetical protein [Azospirillum griseum]|uniref:Uncharacterized protein n=1 Tax=Azospirillum griseum TaxID=2496639 RepID=A0A431VM36_9PROT|nr:hypothetical protein [Azospirillum griseum]RTR22536.1 hypothetical protein EJ903_06890 [Azospirillum griseum]
MDGKRRWKEGNAEPNRKNLSRHGTEGSVGSAWQMFAEGGLIRLGGNLFPGETIQLRLQLFRFEVKKRADSLIFSAGGMLRRVE